MSDLEPRDFDHAFDTTDLDNSKRFVTRWGHNLAYVPEREKWLVWNGTSWEWDDTGQALRWAVETFEYAAACEWQLTENADDARDLEKHAKRSLSESKLRKTLKLAQGAPKMARSLEDLDPNPWLLGVENGTVDLRSGTLREPRREDWITKAAEVPYEPDAPAPRWYDTLETVQPGEDVREFLQRAFGYTATGSIREQVIFIPYGDGSNGKSTVVDAVAHALGPLAKTTPDRTFTGSSQQHPEALARLAGSRMVTVTESGSRTRLKEGTIKAVTGGEPIAARFLYGDTFEYQPEFAVWFPVNWRPDVQGEDHGIWRRLVPIPFEVRIGKAERDPDLPSKLREEAAGILAWVVEGASRWFVERLDDQPSEVVKAKAEYRTMMDHVGRFIEEVLERSPGDHVPNDTVYKAAKMWFREQGVDVPSKVDLGRKLARKGVKTKVRSGQRIKAGVVVSNDWQAKLREEAWS